MPRRKIYRSQAEKQAAYRQRERNRQPVTQWHHSDEWETPLKLFAALDAEFHFTLDVAALPHNTKCAEFFSPAENGLDQDWSGTCWMNPPYGFVLREWLRKASESAKHGATVVCLLPARTDTLWFHDFVLPYAEIRYIRGRLRFNNVSNAATFPSIIAVFRPAGIPPPASAR